MSDLVNAYLRWSALRAIAHRGYWLVASLYLVVDAQLSAFQLVFLGTAQGLVSIVCEVPAGVVADTISRKWALIIAHILIGGSMIGTGLVTAFPILVATQMIWGIGWTFASGADVAWITDELREPERTARTLAARGRWEQVGAIVGLVGIGFLALIVGRGAAMVGAGVAMIVLGFYVAVRFTERGFAPTTTRRWRRSAAILRDGLRLASRDRAIGLVLAATFLINGAAEVYGRLYPRRLIDLGLPASPDPIVWFTGLGIAAFAVGALALRIVEARLAGAGVARRAYVAACAIGAVGLLVLASAPNPLVGGMGVLLVGGLALTVARSVGEIWVNARTTSDVRATVQSLLAQAEYAGEIACGVALGSFAQATSIPVTFACAALLTAGTGVLIWRSRAEGR